MDRQFVVGDQDIDARVVQDVTDLGGLEEVVDGHDDRAGVQDAEEGGDEFGPVLEPEADAVAGLDAELPVSWPATARDCSSRVA